MTTIETKVYTFDELSDKAKEKARDWYKSGIDDYEWWDSTYQDALNIGFEMGAFDIYRREMKGKFIEDGVVCAKAIKKDHGEECDTYKAAEAFLAGLIALRMRGEDYDEMSDGYSECSTTFRDELRQCYLVMVTSE